MTEFDDTDPDDIPDDTGPDDVPVPGAVIPPEPPAQLVASLDPSTLREHFPDPAAAHTRADELRAEIRAAPDEIGELIARGDLVDVLRALGGAESLDDALDEALAAVDRADIAGTHAQQHTARVRLARVHRARGDFGDANALYIELLAAATQFGPVVEAYTRQHAGENYLDQGHDDDALAHFIRALAIRTEFELDEAAESRIALAAAERRSGR